MSDQTPEQRISAYLDGTLTPEDGQRLVNRLEGDRELRAEFVRQSQLDHALRDALREEELHQFFSNATPQRERAQRSAIGWMAGLAVAASIAVVGAMLIAGVRDSKKPVVAENSADGNLGNDEYLPLEESNTIATIVRTRNCEWGAGEPQRECGELIEPGTTMSLDKGSAEIALENGVRLIITGPCEVQLESEMHGRVARGAVTAKVPAGATGYSLTTPSSEVIDLGTEFGVAVDLDGKTEVHVFDGEVVSRWSDAEGKHFGKSVRLREQNAARFAPAGRRQALIEADESQFVRDLAPRLPAEELPPLPLQADLALWLSADRLVEVDADGAVSGWGDLVCDIDQTAEVALQLDASARPRLVEQAIGGMPAVRFDGLDDHLITTPLETADDQTLFAVIQIDGAQPSRGQIINYNGPPHRVLSFPSTPGVLQMDARYFADGKLRLAGFVHSGYGDARGWATEGHVLSDVVDQKAAVEPLIVAYQYSRTKDVAKLVINGQVVAKQTAPWPAGLTSRKVIGRHAYDTRRHLRGDIAELIIYNSALDFKQIAAVSGYLQERYGILQGD